MQKQSSSLNYLAAVTGIAFLAMAQACLAQHEGPYLTADAGLSLVQDTSVHFQGTDATLKTDPGARIALGVGYSLYYRPEYEADVQFETGVIYNPLRKISFGEGDQSVDGDFYQVPILVDIIYGLHFGPLVPYLGIGGGVVYGRLDVRSIGDLPVDTTDDQWDPAVQALAGLRYKFDERNELGVGYKFLAVFPDNLDYIGTHSLSLTYLRRF